METISQGARVGVTPLCGCDEDNRQNASTWSEAYATLTHVLIRTLDPLKCRLYLRIS